MDLVGGLWPFRLLLFSLPRDKHISVDLDCRQPPLSPQSLARLGLPALQESGSHTVK